MIDLDKKNNSEEVIEAVQQKLVEMAQDGSLEATGRPTAQQTQGAESEAAS